MGRDLDLDAMWSTLCRATRDVIEQAGIERDFIVGVAATSLRHGLVVIDTKGEKVYAGPTADARATAEAFALAAERGAELQTRTGRWPTPVFGALRLQWLAKNDPEGFARAEVALSVSDWVAWRLCGESAFDRTHACETLLLDIDQGAWAPDLAETLGIPARLLPPLLEPGAPRGRLSNAAAADLGLPPGIPVAQGGADTSCGLLGVGVVDAGQAAIVAGTSAPLQMVVAEGLRGERIWTGHHLLPEVRVLESNAGVMGEALEFAAHMLFADDPTPAARLLAEAGASEPGARGMQSSVGAEIMDARALAIPVGQIMFSHLGMDREPDARRHMARAIAEGLAYSARANLEQLEEIAGQCAPALHMTGGMSRSHSWASIVANVLDRPVHRGDAPEGSAIGAALCAAVGAGRFEDLRSAAEALVRLQPAVEPDPQDAARYAELYPGWMSLREARASADELARGQQIQALLRSGAAARKSRRPARAPRILATADLDASALEGLRELGEVEYASYREKGRLLQGPDLASALEGFDIFITEIDLLDVDTIAARPELRIAASCRGNAVNIAVEACSAFGIPVLNAPGRNAQAVADLALGFMLMLARKLDAATRFLLEPHEPGDTSRIGSGYAQLRGSELWGLRIGLVGMGAVGREVARRARSFDAEVVAYDPFVEADAVLRGGARPVSLDELLASSDFVSLHAAVSDASRGLIDAQALARMKPGAFLINTARAALVDEVALVEALRSGHLAGAGIDTFSVEPPGSSNPLVSLEQVLTTPHIGGNTRQVAIHQGQIVARALRELLDGDRPKELLNPETLEGFDWGKARSAPDEARLSQLRSLPGPAVTDLQKGSS
jgi:autoinducer 2 (AI-2) kinase